MVKDYIHMLMEVNMKVNGMKINNMAMELKDDPMVLYMKEIILME